MIKDIYFYGRGHPGLEYLSNFYRAPECISGVRYPPYVIASAINYYKGGLSCANVVEEIRDSLGYNITSPTVLNWLKKAGVTCRPRSQAKNMDTQINRENVKMVISVTLFHSSSLTPEKFMVLDI
jgi:hypothetical protein